MAESLVGGAALEAVFGELLSAVLKMRDKAIMFKSTLADLRSTLEAIAPVIKEIEQHNNDLGRPKEEVERLIREMEEGTKLVWKCSKIHRLNYLARTRYQDQLVALLTSLLRFIIIEMQTQTARDQKETLLKVTTILDKSKIKSENNRAMEHLMSEKSYDQLYAAEKSFLGASAEVLGKGRYGTSYKAILEDGTTVAVKRLKGVGDREFEQKVETVQSLARHPNVIPLRAYHNSMDQKLLIYDYIVAGSFSRLLHGTTETGRTPLLWDSRMKISLGAARGIAHIHSASGGRFVHGNIKSSNVLVTVDLQGCISDFGLTPLVSLYVNPSGTKGYRAPEVIETVMLTHKSDVYSFGVLLLEMLSGKTPFHYSQHKDVVDLPNWVQSIAREEWTAQVFDIELLRYENREEEMLQMLQLAITCVARVPDLRPSMEEVVGTMEEIKASKEF